MALNHLQLVYTTSGHVAEPFEPMEDDQGVVNDVTVNRVGGSSARVEVTEGRLSTAAPPAGVGRYDTSVDLSLYADADTADQAAWRAYLGTVDEARYPNVSTKLQAATALIPTATMVDCGDLLSVTSLPAWVPPGPVRQLIQGYTEVLEPFGWDITYNASPYAPYRVLQTSSQVYGRLDSETTTLAEDLDTTETGVEVMVADGSAPWITTATRPGDFPFDVAVGGEEMTVTGASHAVGDFFTRTVVDGWGNASTTGQAWTLAGGNGPDFDVNGTAGTFTNTQAVNVEGIQEIAGTWQDIDQTVQVTFQSLPVAANIFAALWARRGTSSRVKARLFHTTADNLNIDILGNNAATVLGSVNTVLTGVNGVAFNARLQVVGTTIRLKVWRGAEPVKWTLEVTDTAVPAAGGIALSGLRQTGNTNVNPVMEFDNYAVTNPQRFTVTRSANGIVKTHLTGAEVRLARPLSVALGG